MKDLIAYFSRAGNNYVGGSIKDLSVGNTEVAAKMIQRLRRGDTFRIDTVVAYPADYNETTNVAQRDGAQRKRHQEALPRSQGSRGARYQGRKRSERGEKYLGLA